MSILIILAALVAAALGIASLLGYAPAPWLTPYLSLTNIIIAGLVGGAIMYFMTRRRMIARRRAAAAAAVPPPPPPGGFARNTAAATAAAGGAAGIPGATPPAPGLFWQQAQNAQQQTETFRKILRMLVIFMVLWALLENYTIGAICLANPLNPLMKIGFWTMVFFGLPLLAILLSGGPLLEILAVSWGFGIQQAAAVIKGFALYMLLLLHIGVFYMIFPIERAPEVLWIIAPALYGFLFYWMFVSSKFPWTALRVLDMFIVLGVLSSLYYLNGSTLINDRDWLVRDPSTFIWVLVLIGIVLLIAIAEVKSRLLPAAAIIIVLGLLGFWTAVKNTTKSVASTVYDKVKHIELVSKVEPSINSPIPYVAPAGVQTAAVVGQIQTPQRHVGLVCGHVMAEVIYQKWMQTGGETGPLGCPTLDETNATPSPQGTIGRVVVFAKGGEIMLHSTGAHAGMVVAVSGPIWQQFSLGYQPRGTGSWLGFAIDDEHDVPGLPGARQQDFEGGSLTWDPNISSVTAVRSTASTAAPSRWTQVPASSVPALAAAPAQGGQPASELQCRSGRVIYRYSDPNLQHPSRTTEANPQWTPEGLNSSVASGSSVEIKFDIGADGVPRDACVSGILLGYGLDQAAINAVMQWRFRPAMLNGQPVPYTATANINFYR